MKRKLFFVIAAILFFVISVPALASSNLISISVSIGGVNLFVNDLPFEPQDTKGNVIKPIIYNGTTYLPARAIAQVVGLPVVYDPKSKSVYIGNHDSDVSVGFLSDLKPLESNEGSGLDYIAIWSGKDVYEQEFGNGILFAPQRGSSNYQIYNLGGQYNKLKAYCAIPESQKEFPQFSGKSFVKIYADDKLVKEITINYTDAALPFEIDLKGVQKLKILVGSAYGEHNTKVGIVDTKLY